MKPLIVLLSVFLLSMIVLYLLKGYLNYLLAGRIAMAVMLFFTAIAHVKFSEGMTAMIPDVFRFKTAIVYFTGVLEILFAVGILLPRYQALAGWLCIAFLILILPANINAAYHHLDYQTGEANGNGLKYLWFRIPLQFLFISWIYYFVIAKAGL